MRYHLLPILLAACAALPAAVVQHESDDGTDWWQAAKDPVSFGELDGNGDGTVDAAEWKAGRGQLERALKETRASIMQGLDRDQSGKVSRYEAAEGRPRLRSLWTQTRALGLASWDKDHDGTLSDAERKPVVARCTAVLSRFGARVDADGDHRIENAEVEAAVTDVIEGRRKLFSLCDRNNDGQLTQKEVDVAFDLMRAIAGD